MGLKVDFSQLQHQLEEMPKKLSKDLTDNALKKSAIVVLAEQAIEVPKDTHKLEHSLMIGKIKGTGTNRKVQIGINPLLYKQLQYGFYQEWGTKHFAGTHWMKRSWIKSRSLANRIIVNEIQKGLKN